MSKVKMALCVHANHVKLPYGMWNTYLVDRAYCDDPNLLPTEHQQLLPYFTLTRGKGIHKEVLSYSRGKGSAEARLRSKNSVGFGGHVDSDVPIDQSLQFHEQHLFETYREGQLMDYLISETMREADEELPGFFIPDPTGSDQTANVENKRQILADAILKELKKRHFIQIESAPVDKVHLGISIVLDCDEIPCDPKALTGEEGQVVNVEWISLADAIGYELKFNSYEGWSQYVLRTLVDW